MGVGGAARGEAGGEGDAEVWGEWGRGGGFGGAVWGVTDGCQLSAAGVHGWMRAGVDGECARGGLRA